MRYWLLTLLTTIGALNATEIGEISELKGNGEISRQDSSDYFLAELASDIFSFDEVRTGNGRIAVEFIELFKVSAATSNIIPEALASTVSEYPPIFDILFAI